MKFNYRKENRSTEKKSIALKATTNDFDSSSEDDEETSLMTNHFRRFLKYRRKGYNQANSKLNDGRCFNYNKLGHVNKICPYPDKSTQ